MKKVRLLPHDSKLSYPHENKSEIMNLKPAMLR